jgi:SpoIID/LytB domain protein
VCGALGIIAALAANPSRRPAGAASLSAQSTITDADLGRASGARTVAVRGIAAGPITRLPLEAYVARVLAGEGEPGAPEATHEALAIAIRTFAIFNATRHRSDGFDMCDTTHCQVLRAATVNSRRAALATAGRILTYQGAPAEIFYSASCGGRSESASEVWSRSTLPYLRSVEDDVHEGDVPWTLELTLDDAGRALRRLGFEGSLRDVEVATRNESGRVSRLTLSGMRPGAITGEQFRAAVGTTEVRSTAFAIVKRGSTLQLTGRGYGHGVGMCVVGAGRRARRGESVGMILATYYPGLAISRLDDAPEVSATRPSSATPIAAPLAAPAPTRGVTARVPNGSPIGAPELQRLASRAQQAISKALGTPVSPVTVELHETLDSFRAATGAPWWVDAVVNGTTINLAPAAVIETRGGIEPALRRAFAELAMRTALTPRPVWARVGGARYFARLLDGGDPARNASATRAQCPTDAELTLALSAGSLRDAEARAEACFARAYAQTSDWRSVR